MPWSVDQNKMDQDQREILDDTGHIKYLHILGYAGTGKSVLLVNRIEEIFGQNSTARICVVSFTHALLDAFRLGFREKGLHHRIADKDKPKSEQGMNCIGGSGKIDLVTKYGYAKNTGSLNPCRYDFVFIDEVQDVTNNDLRGMKTSNPKVGWLAGDQNQSIYRFCPQSSDPTIIKGDISRVLQAETRQLTYGHRLTPSVLECVYSLMPEIKRNLLNEFEVSHDRDTQVVVAHASDENEEVQYVYDQALDYAEDIELTAILFPVKDWIYKFCKDLFMIKGIEWSNDLELAFNSKNYEKINEIFGEKGVNMEYVGNGFGSFVHARDNNNIILMTYHSSKGMDFQNVFIPFLSMHRKHKYLESFIPRPLMVAMTRSNFNLTISYSGEPLNLVSQFEQLPCVFVNEIGRSDSDDDSYEFPF